ncbi:MAG: type 1 glutamine amidotransferase, partial [Candidatus Omnitrophica bacterium]|nr:type 1 glutamine amidotransferase [Candidatus Omnitrophota bacterium]
YLGVVVSGGPSSAYADLPWIPRLEALICEAVETEKPFLGVCLGHQIAAQALGGKVEKNPRGWEIGDPEVELTEEGKADPFFSGLPPRFRVIQSHQDTVSDLPPGAKLLASSPLCENQSFAIGENFRCVQFHPEMNAEILRFLLTPRRAMLLEKAGIDVEEILPKIRETAESRSLFRTFAQTFLGLDTIPAESLQK